ncbi:GNAT family N-acetyltransferase [Sutcliffiella horikoshii]|uniref:GNAT family N-acetyltransferase n=1 Tax=Sutcliffiella horikoshii TaxID=79883 RepID=UPI00204214D4|nr:GNAT family N-acetyltransferase [Sutcliffiella horikoshii]
MKSIRNPLLELRALQLEDFHLVKNWSEDEAFCQANGWETGRSECELYAWWSNCVKRKSQDFLRIGIQYETRLIGYGDLANINDNSAELGIAIGESGLWGHGVGTRALMLLINFATEKFGIQVFEAETHECNTRSRKMLENLGFFENSRIGSESYMGKESQLIQYRYERGMNDGAN